MSKVRATLILYKELGMSKLDEEGLMDQMEEFPWFDKSCALSRVFAELQIFLWVMVRRRLGNLCFDTKDTCASKSRATDLIVCRCTKSSGRYSAANSRALFSQACG